MGISKRVCSILLTVILTAGTVMSDMESVSAGQTGENTGTVESVQNADTEEAVKEEAASETEQATQPQEAEVKTSDELAKQLQKNQAVNSAQASQGAEVLESTETTESTETAGATETTEDTETAESTEETEHIQTAGDEETETVAAIEKPYAKVKMSELLTAGTLISTDTANVTMKTDDTAGGVLFSGTAAAVKGAVYSINQSFDFNGNSVGRISVDGLSEKAVNLSLAFYLDDQTEPFVTVALNKQKKSGKWTYDGERTTDISGVHITGEHQVSFKVVSDSDAAVTFLLRSIEFVESSVPVIYFNIDESEGSIAAMNQDASHETECYGDMTVQIPDGYTCEYTNKALKTQTYSMEYIRGRGNSTWMCDKKPYKIKLDSKENLFGMGKSKHWVLLANRYDNSLLRNKATYWLGQQLGMEYTPQCVFVDVVMNGTYYGSYYLCDQVRVGSSSVEIDDLEDSTETQNATDEPTITGGYLLSMFPYGDEEKLSFTTTKDNQFLIESPAFEGYENETQYNYIKNYVQQVEDAIYGDGFKTADGVGYADLMDVNSAVNYYWIQEISMNGDAFVSTSTYLYKKRSGKLYWGPLWDFDFVAWGAYDYSTDTDCSGFVQKDRTWFAKLFEDKEFAAKVVEAWPQMKAKLLELCKDGGQLDTYKQQVAISERYDLEKWGSYDYGQGTSMTYDQEVERLKTWIQKRVAWIDENVNTLIPTEYTVQFVDDGKTYATHTVVSGKSLGELPVLSDRKDDIFVGWYTTDEDGMTYKATADLTVSANVTFTAKWVKKSEIVPVQKLYTAYQDVYKLLDEGYYYMKYTVTPYDATFLDVTWSSSDDSIASVDTYGNVTFLKTGTVKITGTCVNGVKASYNLHIVDYDDNVEYPYNMTIDHSSLKMQVGKYAQLKTSYEPSVCMATDCKWYSTDESVVQVSDAGVVNAVGEGTATIIAYNQSLEIFAKCTVSVTKPVQKGDIFTVSNLNYKVTKVVTAGGTVTFQGTANKKLTKVEVPDTVKIKGKAYKVTAVGGNALKNNAKVTTLVLGKNITSIEKSAFYGCKKLKSITIKTAKLKSVGKNAWKGIPSTAKIKVPDKQLKKYKKSFQSAGLSKKVQIKKI